MSKGIFEDFLNAREVKRLGIASAKLARFGQAEQANIADFQQAVCASLDKVKHVYEFGGLIHDFMANDGDIARELFDEANDLIMQGSFHLPFSAIAYCFIQPDAPAHGQLIAYLTRWDDGSVTIGLVVKSSQGNWCASPVWIGARQDEIGLLNGTPAEDDVLYMQYYMIVVATMLLVKNAPVFAEDDEKETKRRNQLRRMLGKRLIPATLRRVTHINRVSVVGIRNGHGSPKSPHDRSGHWRHLQGGRQVWVRDTKVKGGAPAPRTIHDVRD